MASDVPSDSPSTAPGGAPPFVLSDVPSLSPSSTPSELPSLSPSHILSFQPSDFPSLAPFSFPTSHPTNVPTLSPTPKKEKDVSSDGVTFISRDDIPSYPPLSAPASGNPILGPSGYPVAAPNKAPGDSLTSDNRDVVISVPSSVPIPEPSSYPSSAPSHVPSPYPSSAPSHIPSLAPSSAPSDNPTSTPSAVPSFAPSMSPSAAPSPAPSTAPSDFPSSFPSFMPSDLPSWKPSSIPSDMPSLGPSTEPTAGFDFNVLPGVGEGSDKTTSRDAPAIEDGGNTDSSTASWSIVGGAATVGAFLAVVLVLLLVRHRRRERSTSQSVQSQLPIVIPGFVESDDPQNGIFSVTLDSRLRPDSTKSMEIASRSNEQDDMLPLTPLSVPSIVQSAHNDEVHSEMSPMSATVNAKEETNGLCGCLDAANSEDATIDVSFVETDKALNDLLTMEKTRSSDTQSQNSSLKGLKLVGTRSKEVEKEKAEESGAVVGFLKEMFGFRKEKPPLRDQAHYFNNDEPCKSDEVSYDFEEQKRPNNAVSDAEVAPTASNMMTPKRSDNVASNAELAPTASNIMTPKRSNRSNDSATTDTRARFFRGSGSKTFEDNTKL